MIRYGQIVGAILVASVAAQGTNGDICIWQQARAGVVRDSLYIEGGAYHIWKDGSCVIQSRPYGNLFQLNFSTPFDTTKGSLTNIFTSINETIDPSYVPYINGFMVADNDEWYTIGGQANPSIDKYSSNTGITRDAVYIPNPLATAARLGLTPNVQVVKGNLTNKYITNGAGVSIPNESLGFYFSGLRSTNSSPLSYQPLNQTNAPTTLINSMLKVDTSIYSEASWYEIPLPANVVPRAEAMMAWVPVGPKGALVVMGGVPYPTDLYLNNGCFLNNSMTTQNNNVGPKFMSNLTIYDVATGSWYTQATQGNPPQLAQACTVAATSQDNKTHNIYVYGGYNGVDDSGTSDDVWVLSLPSFTWIKVAAGSTTHARYGHVCAKPYPNQMIVVGGTRGCGEALKNTPIIDVFDLNNLKWTGSYDPTKFSEYVVPSQVSDATKATPTASMAPGLLSLFQTAYTGSLPHWYPYALGQTANGGNDTSSSTASQSSWVIPVAVAVPVGVIIVGTVLACFFLPCCLWYRKRKGASTKDSRGRTSIWVRDQAPRARNSDRSEDDTTQVDSPPGMAEAFGDTYFKPVGRTDVSELNDNSNHNLGSPTNTSGYASPQSPYSPGATPLRSELQADTPLFELAAEPTTSGLRGPTNYKTHPMYPPSLGDHMSSVGPNSISSPSSDAAVSPQELAENRRSYLPKVPNDVSLAQSNTSQTTSVSNVKRKNTPPSTASHDVSPDLSATKISPELRPTLSSSQGTHLGHQRNVSSLSSTALDETNRPSTREEVRRSNYISSLPDSPNETNTTTNTTAPNRTYTRTSTANHSRGQIDEMISPFSTNAQSPTNADNLDEVISPATSNTSPVRPLSGGFPRTEITRREIKQWPRHNERSAYKENEDTYGAGRDTV